MLFKSATPFLLSPECKLTPEDLEEQLMRAAFRPCAGHEPATRGWGMHGNQFVFSSQGFHMITLVQEKRLLPSKVVKKAAKERAAAIESQQGHAPGRKQMREITETVMRELLPKAMTQQTETRAWFDFKNGMFFVETATPSKADAVIEVLRTCLDEFPFKPLHTNQSPTSWMADALVGQNCPPFTIDMDCELVSPCEGRPSVRYARHSLDLDEIKSHLAQGKIPKSLALTWDDRVSFVLTEKMSFKRVAYLDLLSNEHQEADTAEEQKELDFFIAASSLARVTASLVDALGGLAKE